MAGKAEYKNKWQKENMDRINLTMPKGRKEHIKTHAEQQGESVNGFINRAIVEAMERDLAAREETHKLRRHSDGSAVLPGFFDDYSAGKGGIVTDRPTGGAEDTDK